MSLPRTKDRGRFDRHLRYVWWVARVMGFRVALARLFLPYDYYITNHDETFNHVGYRVTVTLSPEECPK